MHSSQHTHAYDVGARPAHQDMLLRGSMVWQDQLCNPITNFTQAYILIQHIAIKTVLPKQILARVVLHM